jgi:hypothetical protein
MNKKLKIIIIIFIILISIALFVFKQLYYYNSYLNLHPKNFKNHYKNKKVALLISGQIRDGFYECLMSQKACIVDLYDTDIFCSFSDDVSDKIKQTVVKVLNPKYIEWEKSDNKFNISDKYYLNTYLMFKKIYLCNKYKLKYEKDNNFKYDIVIRTRPDLILSSSLPKLKFGYNIIYYPELNVSMYKYGIKYFSTYTDQMAFGNSQSMDVYANINKYFLKILKANKKVIPEQVVHDYIKYKKINSYYIDYKYVIYKYCYNVNNEYNEKIKVLRIMPSYVANKMKVLLNIHERIDKQKK